MAFDGMTVSIELIAIDRVSEVLMRLRRQLKDVQESADKTSRSFSALGLAMKGTALLFGGAAVLGVLDHMADKGREMVALEEKLITSGVKRVDVMKMVAEANRLSATKGDFTSTQYLEGMVEMRNTLPDLQNMTAMSPHMADFMTDMKVGDPNGNPEGEMQDTLKLAAMRGKLYFPGTKTLDEAGIADTMDMVAKITRFTNGQQNAHSMRMMAAQEGPAALGMTDQAMTYGAELANTMGAAKAGTAVSSFFQQFIGGVMPKWVAENLMKPSAPGRHDGILDDRRVEFAGNHATLLPGALPDKSLAESNPFQFMNEITQKYAKMHDMTQQEALYQIMGRATSQREASDVVNNIGELVNAWTKTQQAFGVKATADEARKNNYNTVHDEVTSGWSDVQKNIGISLIEPGGVFMKGMLQIANALKIVNAYLTDDKNAAMVAAITKWTAIAAGAVTFLGVLALAGAAIMFLAPVFMFALGFASMFAAGMVIFANLRNGTIEKNFLAGLEKIGDFLLNLGAVWGPKIAAGLKIGVEAIYSTLAAGFDWVWGKLRGYFSSIMPNLDGIINHPLQTIVDGIINTLTAFVRGLEVIGGALEGSVGGVLGFIKNHSFGLLGSAVPSGGGSSAVPGLTNGSLLGGPSSLLPPPPAAPRVTKVVIVGGHVNSTLMNPGILATSTMGSALRAAYGTDSPYSQFNARSAPSSPGTGGL
jgi:hypothetical protein